MKKILVFYSFSKCIYVFLCFSGKATGRRDLTSTCSPSGKAVPWFDAKPKCWPQSVVHQLLQAFVRDWGRWERQNYPSSIWNWSNARLGTSHSRQVWAVFWLQVRTNWINSVATYAEVISCIMIKLENWKTYPITNI